MSNREMVAFHGTSSASAESIVENGFRLSNGDKEWLGDGVYFFVEGDIGVEPKGAAVKWAIAQSHQKRRGTVYRRYSIIECKIKVDEDYLLDLNTKEGMIFFNKARNRFMQKLEESDYIPKQYVEFKDGHIVNLLVSKSKIPLQGVIGNFYIKFKLERLNNIYFRVPNCTILALRNVEAIEQDSSTIVLTRDIPK